MKKIGLVVLGIIALGYISCYAGLIEENITGCLNPINCGKLISSSTTVRNELIISSSSAGTLSRTDTIKWGHSVFIVCEGTGVINMNSTPTISTAAVQVGQIVVLRGNNDTNTIGFQDDGTVNGTNLQLGGALRTLGLYDILGLYYDGRFWIELFFENN